MDVALHATWSLEQVRQVQGLYCVLAIDEVLFERDGENVMQGAREKLAKRIVRDSHLFGVEVHPADVDFQIERPDCFPAQVMVRAKWAPASKTVEFRGGAVDGRMMGVQRVGDPILVPMPGASWTSADAPSAATFEPQHLRYVLTGWSESGRHWVYEVRP